MDNLSRQDVESMIQDALKQSQFNVGPVVYHEHTSIDSPKIHYQNLDTAPQTFLVATDTTGTTTVPVFGTTRGVPYNFTITGVFLTAKDTSIGNITINNKGLPVATIAKGAVAGVMLGATSLANASYMMGNPLTVVSSSAGNGTVFITYILT